MLPAYYPVDSKGNALTRAMGLPIPIDSIPLGSAQWVDILDMSQWGDRIFIGISIVNPDSSNKIYLAVGPDFAGTSDKIISVPANIDLTFDALTFGYGTQDEVQAIREKKLRALLSNTTGVLSTGSFGYGSSGNPTNGQGVTINGVQYGFYTNTNSPGVGVVPVTIAATAALTWGNLLTVLNNRTAGSQINGILYGEQAVQASNAASTLTLTANYPGTYGQVAIADGGTNLSNTGATVTAMTGGSGGTIPTIHVW